MKQIFLIVAALTTFSSVSFAQSANKYKSNAAVQASHKALTTKTVQLENSLKQNNTAAAEAAVMDILALMRQATARVSQNAAKLHGAEGKKEYDRVIQLEHIVGDYMDLSHNVKANGAKLVQTAKTFDKSVN